MNTVSCELCTMALSYLENMLTGNESAEEITEALANLSSNLPVSFKDECDRLIAEHGDQIKELILSELTDPKAICREIGIC